MNRMTALTITLLWLPGAPAADITPQPGGSFTTPRAPSLVTSRGVREAHVGDTLRLEWRQLRSPDRTPPVEHFSICVYEVGVHDCATANMSWMVDVSAIPGTPLSSGALGSAGQLIGHAYAVESPTALTVTELDRPMHWQVGACTSRAASSCTFSAAGYLWLTSKDLAVKSQSGGNSTSEYFRVYGEAINRGTTDAGPFTSELTIWNAVPTALWDDCVNDVTQPWAKYAFTRSGEILYIPSLLRADGSIDTGDHTIVAVLSDVWFDAPIVTYSAGASARAGEDIVVVGTDDDDIPISGAPGTSHAFVTVFVIDQGESVIEFDEGNNRQAECHIVYH